MYYLIDYICMSGCVQQMYIFFYQGGPPDFTKPPQIDLFIKTQSEPRELYIFHFVPFMRTRP